MTKENRETIQRAIGIIEGASFGAKGATQCALELAQSLLDDVLADEKEREESR